MTTAREWAERVRHVAETKPAVLREYVHLVAVGRHPEAAQLRREWLPDLDEVTWGPPDATGRQAPHIQRCPWTLLAAAARPLDGD